VHDSDDNIENIREIRRGLVKSKECIYRRVVSYESSKVVCATRLELLVCGARVSLLT